MTILWSSSGFFFRKSDLRLLLRRDQCGCPYRFVTVFRPLPHFRTRPHWKPPGNPEYARNTLRFPKDEESCRMGESFAHGVCFVSRFHSNRAPLVHNKQWWWSSIHCFLYFVICCILQFVAYSLRFWIRDREVAGLILTHCTSEYGLGKPLTRTCRCHQAVKSGTGKSARK